VISQPYPKGCHELNSKTPFLVERDGVLCLLLRINNPRPEDVIFQDEMNILPMFEDSLQSRYIGRGDAPTGSSTVGSEKGDME
jgi:hypothetical protein